VVDVSLLSLLISPGRRREADGQGAPLRRAVGRRVTAVELDAPISSTTMKAESTMVLRRPREE
jgi:hypothetical protein